MAGPIDEAHRANSALHLLGERARKPIEAVEPTVAAVGGTYELCDPLLGKLRIFETLVKGLGDVRRLSLIPSFSSAEPDVQIHPFAKIGVTVFLAAVKASVSTCQPSYSLDLLHFQQVITGQAERDKAIYDLLKAMDDAYDFVVRTGDLGDIDEARKNILKDLSLQTIQCAYFIRDQAQVKNFCEHIPSGTPRA